MGLSTFEFFKNLTTNNDGFIKLEGDLLKRYQRSLLAIVEDIVEVCEENSIYYSLCGGSALGAIRHGGFIPWDDDMDIFLLAKDRELFFDKFKEKYDYKYWIHNSNTQNYGLSMGQIRQKGTVFRGKEDFDLEEAGFCIDIFWIEDIPDNKILRNAHGFLCMGFGFLLSCRNFFKNRKLMTELMKEHKEIRFAFSIKLTVGFLISWLSVSRWTKLTENVYSLIKNKNSKCVSVPSGRKHYFGEIYSREAVTEVISVPFEDRQLNIPKGYDEYLGKLYGDYLKLPDEDKRETHIVMELKFPESKGE